MPLLDPTQTRFTTRFEIKAHVYNPVVDNVGEALASLDSLKSLLPRDIDPVADVDLIYVVGNLAVGGLLNANDDGVTIEDSLAVYKRFERRLCDIEHNRGDIVGYIIKAGLSEFGSNRIITEDEARSANQPFNIVTVAAVWRVANPDLSNFIMETASTGHPDKDALSLSFEIGFNDYSICLLPTGTTNLAKATKVISSNSPGFQRYDNMLRVNKGSGQTKDGQRVGRILKGTLVPLGQGIVTVPAAAVKGIEVIDSAPSSESTKDTRADNGYAYSSTQFTLSGVDAQDFISHGMTIPDDHIYTCPDSKTTDSYGPDYGRETEPHVTVMYGIKGSSAACVAAVCDDFDPITLTMGNVSSFENDDRPYDVLKVDVDGGEDLQNLYHAIKASTDNQTDWVDYKPHLTLAYLNKGMAKHHIDNNCFAGRQFTFSHLTFSPSQGDKVKIPLKQAQSQVYITSTLMSSASNRVKIPAGLQDKVKNLFSTGPKNYPKADVTLSDGRVLKGVTVFSGEELELDKELNLEGVVITDMNPQMPPQIDDSPVIHPHIDQSFPTKTPEARVSDFKNEEIKKVLQNMPYTDAIIHHLESAARSLCIITSNPSVSSTSTSGIHQSLSSMKLEELKQLAASVKSATKLEDVTSAFANVALFAEEIMKASEQYAKAAEDAKKAKEDSDKQAEAVKADLAEAKKTLKEMKDAKDEADAAAKFQERMTTVASTFNLDNEVRAYVVDEIKACTDDASFDKWFTKAKKMLKGYVKAGELDGPSKAPPGIGDPGHNATTVKTGGETTLPGKDNVDSQDTACMAANAAAIASAKSNPTDKTNIDVIGNILANESLTDTYRRVFAGNTSVGGTKVADFTKK